MNQLGPVLFSAPTATPELISLALLAYVLFLSARRSNRRRLRLRLAVGAFCVFSLYALAMQPRAMVAPRSANMVLITPGAEAQAQKTFLDVPPPAAKIFSLPGADTSAISGFAHQAIPDIDYLKRHEPAMSELHVLGHGLRAYDWVEWDSIKILAQLSPPILGIQSISWQRELFLGDQLRVQGSMTGLPGGTHRLLLLDPGGVADSLVISGNESPFACVASPRTTGNFLYQLLLISEPGDTLVREVFEVVVRRPPPLKILIVEAAIRFDTKYLKNWAGRHRHVLAMRTLISRERYREEFINLVALPLQRIDAALLRHFAVVIMDGKTLAALHANERRALRSAVAQEGLGLLLIPDEIIFSKQNFAGKEFFANISFERFADLEQRLVKPQWPGRDTLQTSAIPAEPFALQSALGMKTLITDKTTRVLAAAQIRGRGKIGWSLLRDSYRWVLAGKPDLHAAYWSYLLSGVARHNNEKEQWNIGSAGPIFIDQPLALTVQTSNAAPLGIATTNSGQVDSIFWAQDLTEPRRWHGSFWPRALGWHSLATQTGEAKWFYVSAPSQWQAWQQAQKITATLQQAARSANTSSRRMLSFSPHAEPIRLIWFFLAFLIGAGYLWLERKF